MMKGGGGEGIPPREIVSMIERNDTDGRVPIYTEYACDANRIFAYYTGISTNQTYSLKLTTEDFDTSYTKIVGHISAVGTASTTRRWNNNVSAADTTEALFPNSKYVTSQTVDLVNFGCYLHIVPDSLTAAHPALAGQYDLSGEWFTYDKKRFLFRDVYSLTGALPTDNAVVVVNGNTKKIYTFRGDVPAFQEVSGGYRFSGATYYSLGSIMTNVSQASVKTVSSSSETTTIPLDYIKAATFDMKDSGGNTFFHKNADMTDYVLPSS